MGFWRMNVSDIYIHDATLLRVVEDTGSDSLTMEILQPTSPHSDDVAPRNLVFSNVHGYQVFDGPFEGSPTILDMRIVENQNGWHRIRVDTNAGYRELYCTSVQVLEPNK